MMGFRITLIVLLAAGVAALGWQASARADAASTSGDAVNVNCPIGKEAIDGKSFIEFEGQRIGLCCPKCEKQFNAWSVERKRAYIQTELKRGQSKGAPNGKAKATGAAQLGEVYALDHCPISGEKLGGMGDPVVRVYDGREVRFCCAHCIKDFEKDIKASFKKLDAQFVRDQQRYYPLDTCIVAGDPLAENGKDVAINYVYRNRLVRLCCKDCIKDIQKRAPAILAKLDAKVVAAQSKDYPLDTCVVSGKKLGSKGKPIDRVIAGRLVRLCCKGCEAKLRENPSEYLAKIDAAWAKKGKFARPAPPPTKAK